MCPRVVGRGRGPKVATVDELQARGPALPYSRRRAGPLFPVGPAIPAPAGVGSARAQNHPATRRCACHPLGRSVVAFRHPCSILARCRTTRPEAWALGRAGTFATAVVAGGHFHNGRIFRCFGPDSRPPVHIECTIPPARHRRVPRSKQRARAARYVIHPPNTKGVRAVNLTGRPLWAPARCQVFQASQPANKTLRRVLSSGWPRNRAVKLAYQPGSRPALPPG